MDKGLTDSLAERQCDETVQCGTQENISPRTFRRTRAFAFCHANTGVKGAGLARVQKRIETNVGSTRKQLYEPKTT